MTLARQLISAISLVFLVMLIGLEAIYLRGAQTHLQDQLESHAQDAATSIGLSLGILLVRGDNALAETVINAAFDRGHYARIEFVNRSGDVLVSKTLSPRQGEKYPQWLAELFPLEGPTAESLVSTGWQQMGRVRVTSHPGYAYAQLWDVARSTLLLLILIYAVALVVLRLILKGILRPLSAIEAAAQAISRRDFVTVDEHPSTRELARVVAAMNSLSRKVREALEVETARAAALREAAYVDPVGGLLNRRGFGETFESRYRHERKFFTGTVALIQVSNLAQVNQAHGQARGDELVTSIGSGVREVARDAGGLAGRWGGGMFVLVVPDADMGVATQRLEALQRRVRSSAAELGLETEVDISVGAVFVEGDRPALEEFLVAAEEALKQAIELRVDAPQVRRLRLEAGQSGTQEQLEILRAAIAAGQIHLFGQRAFALPGAEVLHTEIMGRLIDASGRQIPAAEFMPLVTRHELSAQFDRAVVGKVIERASRADAGATIAVNLSARSIADDAFGDWLGGALTRDLARRVRLVFEIGEYGVLQDEAAAQRFAERIAKLGARFAIDHFGVHRDSLALLRRLGPAYVKLSAVYTRKLADDIGTRFFVESVVRAARQLDVPIIAQSVEDEGTLATLRPLGFGGYQGFAGGRPSPWLPE